MEALCEIEIEIVDRRSPSELILREQPQRLWPLLAPTYNLRYDDTGHNVERDKTLRLHLVENSQ